MSEDQYNQLVDADVNAVDGINARNVDEALAQLQVDECAPTYCRIHPSLHKCRDLMHRTASRRFHGDRQFWPSFTLHAPL